MDIKVLIDSLISLNRETEWIEFKSNYTHHQELGEYISALSNSACLLEEKYGYLIFGIDSNTLEIKGTTFDFYQVKVGNEELENWLATQLDPAVDFKVINCIYNNKPLIILKIDATRSRPVGFRGFEYIRVGSYKKKLTDFPEKERKIWNLCRGFNFENDYALQGLSDDEVLSIIDYPGYFDLTKLPLPSNRLEIINKLLEENICVKDVSRYHITNMGAILLAKNLNRCGRLQRKALRIIQYKGKNKTQTKKEQIWDKGYAIGFQDLIKYINDLLPTNEIIEQAIRKEVKMYPEIAIRELVANALIHQDFNEIGNGPMVEIFEDRIEISNPGKPLVDALRLIDHSPQSRNENLASFMRRVKICEERGSGIDKVVFSSEVFQLPAPKFIVRENYMNVILYAHKSLRQMDKEDKIRACYLHSCIKYVSSEYMTNQSLRERFRIEEQNYATVSRIIADTIEEKLVKYEDPSSHSRRYAKYVPFWA